MKLIDKYLILLCVFVCCSCNYLDIVPDEKPTEEDAFKNPQLTERYLYSCYSYIPDPRDGSYSLDLMTGDDVVTPWEHETFGKFAQGNYTPSNPYINYWHDLFKGIRQCYLLKENLGSVPGLSDELKAAYDKYYANEKFVRVLEKDVVPETKWVEGSNYVDVNFKIDERTGRVVMMGALDNLVKGAAGQAVQNMNLLFGLDESEGLNLVPMFP